MGTEKEMLFGKTLPELEEVARELGMPRYAAGQIAAWLYRKNAGSVAAMTDLSLANREALDARYAPGLAPPQRAEESADGTRKYLFATPGGAHVETAFIPDRERATLCVSSQAGCRMGCAFCMTARQGFQENLTAGGILNQMRSIPESGRLTNIVYMGMGEPLDNTAEVLRSLDVLTSAWGMGWSPARVTVSTIGVIPQLPVFLERSGANLAVSLHSPFPDERASIMPAEKIYPIREVIATLKRYDFSHRRRLSFEYIVFSGLNDTAAHVRELARLLNGLNCRINLIRFHPGGDTRFTSPGPAGMERLRDALTRKGIFTTIRASRGEDIGAACGLLSTKVISYK